MDDAAYTKPSPILATSLLKIFDKVRHDKRFDGLYEHRSGDISKVLTEQEEAFLEYWNAWELSSPKAQFEESQQAAVAILVATEKPGDSKFDFFLVHLLTSSHAVRVLLPLVPAKFHINLVRQWWLFTLAVYIAQLRPAIKLDEITEYDLKGRGWGFALDKALHSSHSLDAHFVKGTGPILLSGVFRANDKTSRAVNEGCVRDMGGREAILRQSRRQVCG